MSEDWAHTRNCTLGLVTGATDISALEKIRTLAPSAWFLCPGVGAQGGTAEVTFVYCCGVTISECMSRCPKKGWQWASYFGVSWHF